MLQPVPLMLLVVALLAYLQSAVAYVLLLAFRRPRFGRWATIGLLVGVGTHGLSLLVLWLGSSQPFFDASVDNLVLYAWLTVAVYLVLERTLRQKALGALIAPLACVAVLAAIFLPRYEHPALAPFATSLWLPIHVSVSFASYASLTVAFGSSVLYLFQERQLKGRRLRSLFQHLPPLGTLELVTHRLIEVGFVLLTLAILLGVFGSARAWGSYWSWEPKEMATLVTWLIYLGYLHLRNVARWSGRQTSRLAIAGFVAVLITYLAVSLVLPGQHDFGLAGRL